MEPVLHSHVIDFQCERWLTADGKVITAPLPEGFDGHFGPQLRRFVLAQYHQGQTTVPRLLALLRGFGIDISKREVVRLLTTGHDSFHEGGREVLRAGLASAAWITVDDTGARHKANNGFCTQIGNAHFTAFATTTSKSRLNFLSLLRAGHGDYVVNDAALAYMRERALAAHVIARLTEHPDRYFADQAAWAAHLEKLGIAALKVNPDPTLIATEGALWGSVKAHGFPREGAIVSDDAGQFKVGQHGLCWFHAERLVHKLDTFTDQNRAAQSTMRAAIWQFYSDLKAYRCVPTARARPIWKPNSIASSPAKPASSPSTACSHDFMPTRRNCSRCSTAPKFRCIPTAPRTTSAVTSQGAKSRAAPAAISVATHATPSSASPRPAPNSASASGITSAHGSTSQGPPSRRSPT
jgi:hypothetical protein